MTITPRPTPVEIDKLEQEIAHQLVTPLPPEEPSYPTDHAVERQAFGELCNQLTNAEGDDDTEITILTLEEFDAPTHSPPQGAHDPEEKP